MRSAAAVLAALLAAAAVGAWWLSFRQAHSPPPPSPSPARTQPPPRPPAVRPVPPAKESAERTTVLKGQVRDRNGTPIAGARVQFTVSPASISWDAAEAEGTTLTDGNGRFRLVVSADVGLEVISVSARGFVEERHFERFRPPEGDAEVPEITIVLSPGGTLVGRVFDAEGGPVARARIVVGSMESGPPRDAPWAEPFTLTGMAAVGANHGTSGEDGTFVVDGIPLEPHLWARAESGDWQRSPTSMDISLTAEAPEVRREFRLPKKTPIRVRVLGPDGSPVPSARVGLEGGDSRELVRPLGTPGEFEVRIPFTGSVKVSAWADELLPGDRRVFVVEGVPQDIEIQLKQSAAIEGTLVNDEGEPRFGVIVGAERVKDSSEEEGGRPGPATSGVGMLYTNLEGRFRIDGLRPGTYHLTTRFGADYRVHTAVPVEAPAADVQLVLHRLATARVRLCPPPGEEVPARYRTGVADQVTDGNPKAWGDGIVEWKELEPGEKTLMVWVDGHAPLTWTIDVRPGAQIDLGAATPDRGHAIEWRIVDLEGKPVARATVGPIDPRSDFSLPIGSDSDGRITLSLLPPGEMRFIVSAEGFLPAEATAVLPSPAVTVVLRRGALVEGKALLSGDSWPQDCTVVAIRTDGKEDMEKLPRTAIGADGTFRMQLPAGPWRFLVQSRLGEALETLGTTSADLKEGGTMPVTVDCRK